jgi:hypothetical protein
MSAEVEMQQGKNIADVAKEVGVQHYICSSLMDVTKRKSLRPSGSPCAGSSGRRPRLLAPTA